MKYSKQRQAVLQTVLDNKTHPTAETLYNQLRETMPEISLGTVYRNLNALAEHGAIKKVLVPNGPDRFDFRIQPHEHMLCTQCGKVFDINIDIMDDVSKKALTDCEFYVTDCSVTIYGLCSNCKHKNNKKSED